MNGPVFEGVMKTLCWYLWQVASSDRYIQGTATTPDTSAAGPPKSSFSIIIPRIARGEGKWKAE